MTAPDRVNGDGEPADRHALWCSEWNAPVPLVPCECGGDAEQESPLAGLGRQYVAEMRADAGGAG